MMQKRIITMEGQMKCEYLLSDCPRLTNKAIIWQHELVPNRWIMMPVCPDCFTAAMFMYQTGVSDADNLV